MLKAALLKILEEKPIDKITIYELCKEAQINRTTFYKYYGSQYDLLEEIENDNFNELQQRLAIAHIKEQEGLVLALQYLENNWDVWRTLVNTVEDQKFTMKLFQLPVIYQLLDSYIAESPNGSRKKYIYIYICHGCYAIIREWINQDDRETPEEIAELIIELCKKSLDI